MRCPQAKKGQVMLLTVLLTGGVLLAATAVAGLMMVYQIRQTTAAINSVQAIFAADAAVEWDLFCRAARISGEIADPSCFSYPVKRLMSNGSFAVITLIEEGSGIRVVGTSHQASRAFELKF